MSFWTTFEDLATVTEDIVGEEIEEITDEVDSPGIRRLNSEGEESNEATRLEEEYLTRTRGRTREDDLFLLGVEYEDEYFDSLSDNYWSKDQKCVFCKVLSNSYKTNISILFPGYFQRKSKSF